MINLKNKYLEKYLLNNLFPDANKVDLTCSKCSFLNDEGDKFCSKCGVTLSTVSDKFNIFDNFDVKIKANTNNLIQSSAIQVDLLCSKCSFFNIVNSKFCANCGNKLEVISGNETNIIENNIDENKVNIFLGSNVIDINEDYDKFEYFIGFGNSFYNFLDENFGFETSRTLDGFVRDQTIEDSFPDANFDILFIFPYDHTKNDIRNRMLCPVLELVELFDFFGKNINISINAKKEDVLFESIASENALDDFIHLKESYGKINFLESNLIPNKYLETSKSLIFVDLLDSRLYYADFIKEKSFVFSTANQIVISKYLYDAKVIEYYNTFSTTDTVFKKLFSNHKDFVEYISQFYINFYQKNYVINGNKKYNFRTNILRKFNDLFSSQKEYKISDISIELNESIKKII